jgi:hypothetical protein
MYLCLHGFARDRVTVVHGIFAGQAEKMRKTVRRPFFVSFK